MKKENKYKKPTIEVLEVKIEKGFEISNFITQSPNEGLADRNGNGEVMGHEYWGAIFN